MPNEGAGRIVVNDLRALRAWEPRAVRPGPDLHLVEWSLQALRGLVINKGVLR